MANPTPTIDQVLNAVVAEMNSMTPLPEGAVLYFEGHLPSEAELLRKYRDAVNQSADVWLVSADVDSEEGPAPGELYSLYRVRVRYLSVRVDEEEWSRQALFEAERVRTELEANAGVFAIGGQRQLRATEAISVDGAFKDVEGSQVFEANLRFTVEARRWQ